MLGSGRDRRLVIALSATMLLLWIGATAILPLLPVYLRHQGSSNALVGIVMAAYFAASVITQYPMGRLSDRLGRRPVVLAGLVVFAIGSLGFAGASQPLWAIAFRALQGIGAGAVTVASAAAIGTLVPLEARGGAFGALYGSQMLAAAGGPLVGSVVGQSSMRILFLGAAIAAVVAAGPVLAVLPAGRMSLPGGGAPGEHAPLPSSFRGLMSKNRALFGVLVVFACAGCFGGMYETCWTLLLRARHAADFEVGLSWTLFALPYAALSIPAGRLANRFDRRVLAIGATLWTALFCALYPLLHAVSLLIGLGFLEAIGTVAGSPPALLVLSETTPPALQGRAQGAVETARTAAMAAAAALSGVLFGLAPAIPFELAAGIGVVASVAVLASWRLVPEARAHKGPAKAPLRAMLAADAGSGTAEATTRGAG